jgi:hypothetical protein
MHARSYHLHIFQDKLLMLLCYCAATALHISAPANHLHLLNELSDILRRIPLQTAVALKIQVSILRPRYEQCGSPVTDPPAAGTRHLFS